MIDAGLLDRRIEVQVATEAPDASNDQVQAWQTLCYRWARMQDNSGREFFGAEQMVRDADTAFSVRDDSESRTFAPETHRVVYGGRVYEIVSIAPGKERKDILMLLCASRPDLRGARAPEPESCTGA